MQKYFSTAPSSVEKLVQTEDLNIVSEFNIKSSCFIIISVSELLEANHPIKVVNVTDEVSSPILAYFEFNQHCYAILSNNDFLETIDSSFTNPLTARELQIATIVAQGASNKIVANQLHISEWTVSAHLRRIFIKLNVDSRAAMVYKCAQMINQSN
jgi:DNA-binding CsgD family transcriptional regulator